MISWLINFLQNLFPPSTIRRGEGIWSKDGRILLYYPEKKKPINAYKDQEEYVLRQVMLPSGRIVPDFGEEHTKKLMKLDRSLHATPGWCTDCMSPVSLCSCKGYDTTRWHWPLFPD